MLPNKTLAIIVLVSAVAVGGGFVTLAIGIPDSPCFGIAGTTKTFTIIADSHGYNYSVNHQGQTWPIMNVSRCDIVSIRVINTDAQTHGFAVGFYAARGTEVPGQQIQGIPSFLATKAGHFGVYCITRCTAHYLMLSGLLSVS